MFSVFQCKGNLSQVPKKKNESFLQLLCVKFVFLQIFFSRLRSADDTVGDAASDVSDTLSDDVTTWQQRRCHGNRRWCRNLRYLKLGH